MYIINIKIDLHYRVWAPVFGTARVEIAKFLPGSSFVSGGVPSLALGCVSQYSATSSQARKVAKKFQKLSVTLYKICRKQKAHKESRDIEPSLPVFHIYELMSKVSTFIIKNT